MTNKKPNQFLNTKNSEEDLHLSGCPVTLAWRSKQNSPRSPQIERSCLKKSATRPNSSKKAYQWRRPASVNDFRQKPQTCMFSLHSTVFDDQEILAQHHYTAASAKLLKSLLREPWDSEESAENSPKNDPWVREGTEKIQEESEMDEKFSRLFPKTEGDPFETKEETLICLEPPLSPEKLLEEPPQPKIKTEENSPRESTYDDLVHIIHEIEDDHKENDKEEEIKEVLTPKETVSKIMNYLAEIEMTTEPIVAKVKRSSSSTRPTPATEDVPRLEDLLGKSGIELAQEVLDLRIQVDEQTGGLRLLQQTITDLKVTLKEAKDQHKQEIEKMSNDSEAAISSHQKMVKQILGEKKALNEKIAGLVKELKGTEERHQRNLKAIEERHLVEIQRVKETQAAAEKLKREKWIDVKTQKIKEMTVKGLEPELSRMAARQQTELAELRNLHRAELEAVELRAARRTNELMDQLRTEMARDKEEALKRENEAQRIRWEKVLEEVDTRHEEELKRMKDDLKREKERQRQLEKNTEELILEMRKSADQEKEREKNSFIREYQEKISLLEKNHQDEMKSLRESYELEKDVWMNNFKKLQTNRFLEREAELHQRYKRERDRDIELAIERLESEAAQVRLELTESAENRLKRQREKYETDLKDLEAELVVYKNRLSETKTLLDTKQDSLIEVNTQFRHLQTEYVQLKKICDEMTAQKAELQKIIRLEFEGQMKEHLDAIEQLKKEMTDLHAKHKMELVEKDLLLDKANEEARKELQQVYKRVKTTIGKRDEMMESLREQYKVALERCSHLEHMLDTQRRNLLLN